MPTLLDRTGQRFGLLVVLTEAGRDNRGRATWLCKCDCGTEKVVPSRHLGSGAVVSCGCHRRALSAQNGKTGAIKITGTASPLRKAMVGYNAAHQRVRSLKGLASRRRCVDCGKRARHWSYNLTDPEGLVEGGLQYSLNPDYYEARCVRCHSKHDRS